MRRAPQRPPSAARRGGTLLWVVVVLAVAALGGLAVVQYLNRETEQADPARLQELTAAPLAEARLSAADWPQWRGPRRDGVSTETGLLLDWPEGGPKVLWTQPTGEGFSSVAVARGRAFTMVQDGDDEAVVCWDAATGKEHWRHRYPARYKNLYGNGPRATPTVAGDHVYTVGGTGVMHCLKAFADGPAVVWRKDLLAEFGGRNLEWGVSFSPLVDGGRVYVMPGGPGAALAALDPQTGAVVWQKHDDPPSYSSPVPATLHGVRQVVTLTGTRLLGVRPETGDVLWEFPWEAQQHVNAATPIVVQDYVFVSTGYNKGCAVVKVEIDGDRWKASLVYKNRKLRSHFSTPVLVNGHLYGFDDTNLVCLDFRTGEVKWKERGFDKGSLIAADGHLIIFGEKDAPPVALAAADPTAYREKARFRASTQSGSVWTVPALADGRLYVRDQEKITCFDMRK